MLRDAKRYFPVQGPEEIKVFFRLLFLRLCSSLMLSFEECRDMEKCHLKTEKKDPERKDSVSGTALL